MTMEELFESAPSVELICGWSQRVEAILSWLDCFTDAVDFWEVEREPGMKKTLEQAAMFCWLMALQEIDPC